MLISAHKTAALAHLNDICPDTFDEGTFGPWTFTDLTRAGSAWTLSFDNSTGSDAVAFTFDGDCIDANGGVVSDWFEEINKAILDWEGEHGDDAYGDDFRDDDGEAADE